MTKHNKRQVASYKSKQAAEAHAKRLRSEGYDARVRRDSFGNFIVFIFEAAIVLSLFDVLLRR